MREILFRGKGIDGNWYYGVPLVFTDDYVCMTAPHTYNKKVELNTLGQFTGLLDKNDKKIFEGDILSERPPMNQTAYIGYVAYDVESAVWRFMIKNDTKYNGVLLGSYSNSYKVIGNIHDNPEFLKEGVEE